MPNPHLLIITQNSSAPRLYHQVVESVQYETSFAHSIADALAELIVARSQIVLIDNSFPQFEIHVFLEMLEKKPEWKTIPIIAHGFSETRHLFPSRTHFTETDSEIVAKLSQLCAIL